MAGLVVCAAVLSTGVCAAERLETECRLPDRTSNRAERATRAIKYAFRERLALVIM